jgi:hypothetical protein
MNEKPMSIQYLIELHQHYQGDSNRERQIRVFTDDLAYRSINGTEYAASILYADYLGFRIIGIIEPWVRRLRRYPLMVPETLRSGVRAILEKQNVLLTDEGELISKERPHV